MEIVHIGASIGTKKQATRPLTHLPNRLDAKACLEVLERIHPTWTAESITAAGTQLDVNEIDSCLEYQSLSLSDRMAFKAALSQNGFISRGISRSRRI